VAVPDPIRALAGGDTVRPVWRNELGGLTFAIGDRYVKWAPAGSGLDLDREAVRLRWAAAYLPVPELLGSGADSSGSWLVTRALGDRSAVHPRWLAEPETAVRALGSGLRALHEALPVADCPFSWSAERRVAAVLAQGPTETPAWHPEHAGQPVESLLAKVAEPPPVEQPVVCHGDPCAPNTVLDAAGRVAGHVDLGSLGVADRWADLAVGSWSLDWNYGAGYQSLYFQAYGVEPDPERIAYYRLLWDLAE